MVFAEFVDAKFAEAFMSEVESSKKMKGLVNDRNEKVIIEYAFVDMRIQHKKELIVKNLKEMESKRKEQKQITEMLKKPNPGTKKNGKEEKPKETKVSKKIAKKQVNDNRKSVANLLVTSAIENKKEDTVKQAVEAIRKVPGRGLRNRLKRKLEKTVGKTDDEFSEIRKQIKKDN